ncbi:MAG: hypothetical protein QW638_02530 [Candidatus Bathyarchaeia archaeon]
MWWKIRGSRYYFKHGFPLPSLVYSADQRLNITEGAYRELTRACSDRSVQGTTVQLGR